MNVDLLTNNEVTPTSWNYGSFYGNNRIHLHNPSTQQHVPNPVHASSEDSIFNDEYFRAMNQFKQIYEIKPKSDIRIVGDNDKAVSVILNDSPEKLTYAPKQIIEDQVVVPRETVYMIDKVVRQRTSRAFLAQTEDEKSDRYFSSTSKAKNNFSPDFRKQNNSINYQDKPSSGKKNKNSPLKRNMSAHKNSIKKKLTFEEWYKCKEVERKLKDRLLEDAIHE